ncbi:MFS transporter [Pseudomonas boanensis]|uniref:MFS transporter n=1 Tax=Metapseudomonas boanensis TaxID=2822138 RepID=UPI0035D50989
MTENDYLLAWAAYGLAALGCLLVWFRLTGWMWRWLREPLRLLVAVLLLTPTIVDPAKDLFAPAIAITALDLLFKVGNNAWKAALDLTMYSIIGLTLYLVFASLRWPIERKLQARRAERQAADQADGEPTLREMMQERDHAPGVDTRIDENGDRRLRIEPRL